MQKFTEITALVFCLVSALFLSLDLPASGQNKSSTIHVVAALPADANGRVGVDRDYKLTVSEIQKLYRQSTDGMSPNNNVTQNPATIMYSRGPVVPLSALHLPAAMSGMLSTGVPTQGLPLTDTAFKAQLMQTQQQLLAQISDPVRNIPKELAQTLATQTMMGNSAAQVATAQANSAINYAGKFLINFTTNEGNVWNCLRNNVFVPMALLLLVPGAVLTQTKSMMAAGNPVLEASNPFEGILRAVVAMCFIPGSYLVVNYGIDFSNSISHTIQDAYRTQFGTDMYADAFQAEQRAFPSRQAAENQNGLSGLGTGATASGGNHVSGFAQLENDLIKNKAFAADGTQVATNGLVDEVLPANAVAARMAVFGTNMVVTSIWDLLCAFQLVYLHYLFLVGPIMAAIWVYPIKQLREAWPNWVAGTITLCFWSLFWNTAILLMALFKDADSTGTFIMTALNLLATGSVKYAFDFVGLITEAGQEAAKTARQNQNQAANLSNPAGSTKETKTQNTETKGEGGGILGGLTKVAATSILTAAAPGAAQVISLGSQMLGGLGGSKEGGAGFGLGDFAKSLSLPPLVSSVAENAFPASAAAFGIVGAAGLMGKEGISLPPLAGSAKADGAIGAAADSADLEGNAVSKVKKTAGSSVVETVLGGATNVVDITTGISGSVGAKTGLGSLTAAGGLTNIANLAGVAGSAGVENEGGAEKTEGAADKTAAATYTTGVFGIAAAGHRAAVDHTGASKAPKEAASITAAKYAATAGSIFAAANNGSSSEVNSFLNNMAEAVGSGNGHGASAQVEITDGQSELVSAHSAAIAASMTEVELPPSAGTGSEKSRTTHGAQTVASTTRTNSLFKEGARSLETGSAREFNYAGSTKSNTVNLFREQSECQGVEALGATQLNFAAAPPLSFSGANSYSGPPPMASALAKLASGDAEYMSAGLVGFAEAASPASVSPALEYSEAGSSNYFRAATVNNTTDNTMFYNAAAAIDHTVAALPPSIERAAAPATTSPPANTASTEVNNHMRPSRPDQNENTSGVLEYLEVQPMSDFRRPKSLNELLKPTAFERPCDTCKTLTCHCVFATAPAAGAWA